MGLLSCLKPAPADAAGLSQQINKLSTELESAKHSVAQLKTELLQVQSERVHLLHELSTRPVTPGKQDAGTEMPTVSVAVQVKPPVTMESRIPRPTGEDPKEADGGKSPAKSRIPAAPVVIPAAAAGEPACRSPLRSPHSPGAARSGQLKIDPTACAAAASAVASPMGLAAAADSTPGPSLNLGSPTGLTAIYWERSGDNVRSMTLEQQQQLQRIEVLQQQLKVAEAFRASLEAELRDTRFANNNLQTQMLSLQTKFEKTVEDQVAELERLNSMCKEGHNSHEQVVQQVTMLKHQLSFSKKECTAALREAEAATKQSTVQEQKLQQATEVLQGTQQKLSICMEQLAAKTEEASNLALQLQDVQGLVAAAEARVKQLEDELKAQKALYDSTVDEMLGLNSNYNELKQFYHKLQSETKQHDEMVQLVQQELSELSYYAAAGRVALGLAPASSMQNFTPRDSEVSLPPEGSQAIEGAIPSLAAAAAAEHGAASLDQVAAGVTVQVADGNVPAADTEMQAEKASKPAEPGAATAEQAPTEDAVGSAEPSGV